MKRIISDNSGCLGRLVERIKADQRWCRVYLCVSLIKPENTKYKKPRKNDPGLLKSLNEKN
jgi:hypothetical protein